MLWASVCHLLLSFTYICNCVTHLVGVSYLEVYICYVCSSYDGCLANYHHLGLFCSYGHVRSHLRVMAALRLFVEVFLFLIYIFVLEAVALSYSGGCTCSCCYHTNLNKHSQSHVLRL